MGLLSDRYRSTEALKHFRDATVLLVFLAGVVDDTTPVVGRPFGAKLTAINIVPTWCVFAIPREELRCAISASHVSSVSRAPAVLF